MIRLDGLVEEAKTLDQELAPYLEKKWYPAFFEFSSYYQVGFVTCLEWHAKSRLFDLLDYFPNLIGPEDIKQSLTNPKLLGMASERLTIPHLIARSSRISTLQKYITVFERVLDAIGCKQKLANVLNAERGEEGSNAKVLGELYSARNSLVHEISINDIGHPNIRDFKNLNEVVQIGEIVRDVIQSIETEISKHAPFDFPNLLNPDHDSVTKIEVLARKIREAEEQIRKSLLEDGDDGACSVQDWDSLLQKSHEYIEYETEFIEKLGLPGRQYYDARDTILETLLERRFDYLKLFKQETVGDDDELHPE